MLSTSDELSPAWLLTLTESDCTVVLQQKCDNATLILFISTTTTTTTTWSNVDAPVQLSSAKLRLPEVVVVSAANAVFRSLVRRRFSSRRNTVCLLQQTIAVGARAGRVRWRG